MRRRLRAVIYSDTWESKKNLGNAKELVEEFERKYREEAKELR